MSGNHPYGRQLRGTLDSVPQISADDLKAYTKRVFARANFKIGVVGDIDAATLGRMLDEIFGALPFIPTHSSFEARNRPIPGGAAWPWAPSREARLNAGSGSDFDLA